MKKKIMLLCSIMMMFGLFGQSVFADENADTTVYGQGETYVIGTDTTFAPFEWQSASGELMGIDMEILRAIEKSQNVTFDIRALGFNAALQALESKQVDGVMAGMSITESRKQSFDFSTPYYDSGVAMAVLDNSTISQYADLTGKKVAVKTGTQGAEFVNSIKNQYGFSVNTFEDSSSMYQDVLAGNSVAAFEDSAVMSYAIKDQGLALKVVGGVANPSSYGFAVLKNHNAKLMKIFNTGLAQIKASGEYDKIVDKYVGGNRATQAEDTSLVGILRTNGMVLLSGLGQTLLLTALSITIALALGVILGLFSVSHNVILKGIYTVYVDLMRGTPLMVLALFIYFALPQFFGFKYADALLPSVATLSLNAAAFIGELFRGGIQSVDKGQFEAAHSLGLPYGKTMIHIILPQALKVMVPPFINQFVTTLKDTSILSAIGLVELTQTGKLIISRTYASGNTWLIVAVMYIIVITILTKLSKKLEQRWR